MTVFLSCTLSNFPLYLMWYLPSKKLGKRKGSHSKQKAHSIESWLTDLFFFTLRASKKILYFFLFFGAELIFLSLNFFFPILSQDVSRCIIRIRRPFHLLQVFPNRLSTISLRKLDLAYGRKKKEWGKSELRTKAENISLWKYTASSS